MRLHACETSLQPCVSASEFLCGCPCKDLNPQYSVLGQLRVNILCATSKIRQNPHVSGTNSFICHITDSRYRPPGAAFRSPQVEHRDWGKGPVITSSGSPESDGFHQGLKDSAESVPSGHSPPAMTPRHLNSLVSAGSRSGESSMVLVL